MLALGFQSVAPLCSFRGGGVVLVFVLAARKSAGFCGDGEDMMKGEGSENGQRKSEEFEGGQRTSEEFEDGQRKSEEFEGGPRQSKCEGGQRAAKTLKQRRKRKRFGKSI